MLYSSRQTMATVDLDRRKKPGFFTRLRRSEGLRGYLYVAPWIFGFLVFGLYPLLDTFYNSFTKYNIFESPEWVGLKNYITIFTKDPIFAQACLNMLIYVSVSTCITIGGGLSLAVLLNKKFPGNHFFRTLIYIPSLLVGVAIGLLFKQLFVSGDNGLMNSALSIFHIAPVNWLSNYDNPAVSIIALIIVNFWFMGGAMIIFLAGLKGISQTYYEAAVIDGASKWHTFRYITLPLLSPVIVFNLILTLIGHIQVFETPLVFAAAQGSVGGTANLLGYHNSMATFLTYIYVEAFQYNNFGYASALAVIVFLITMILTLIVLAIARNTYYGDQTKNA